MPQDDFDEILNIFKVESGELLKKIGDNTYSLEENPDNKEFLSSMFQTLHSLKGSARMLGFDDLQNIAHSLEDVVTLVKNGRVELNRELFELFYSSYDILHFGIEKYVEAKSEVTLPEVKSQILKLNKFLEKETGEKQDSISFLKDNVCEINAVTLEIMTLFRKYEEKKLDSLSEAFSILSDLSNQLSTYFEGTGFEEIKNNLSVLIFSCNLEELEQTDVRFKQCFDIVLKLHKQINELYKKSGIESFIESPDNAKKEENLLRRQNETVTKFQNLGVENEMAQLLASFDYNLTKLQEGREPVNIILDIIHKFLISDISESVSIIMKKMSEVLNMALEKNIKTDINALSVYIYCFNKIKTSFFDDISISKDVLDRCLEKLNLLEQLYSISSAQNLDTMEEETELLEKPIQKKSVLLPQKDKNILMQDFFKSFETEEIKTLRVDTQKLDKLVSQTAELIVNGIKSQEHLSTIEQINIKLTDALSEAKKMANFLKYLDKRIMIKDAYDNIISNSYKKMYSYFKQNNNTLNELYALINYLLKKEIEDDTKLNQTISEIENISKNIRVLPLATVFHMFPRMVRDIAKTADKEIEFTIQGSDTSVDKKIIEEIKAPLIHILRNAVDHGIEFPQNREKKGKSRTGHILLSAGQEKNKIVITVEDDGVGINIDKIKSKALEKNLLTPQEAEAMTDEQLTGLIFWPGFSTEDKITEISGRGIGLDIVQSKLSQLNGKVHVFSVMDKGCRVVIELPITMSTMKVFVVSFDNEKFAIPMSAIKLVQWIRYEDIFLKDGQDCIMYMEHSIPVFNMAACLNVKSKPSFNGNLTVIVVEVENTTVAYIVEKLIGDQEILNKKLSLPIHKLKNIGGVTTLPSGDICLILNMNELVRNSLSKHSDKHILTGLNKMLTKEDYTEEDNPALKNVVVFNSTGKLLDYLKKCLTFAGYMNNEFVDYDQALGYIKTTKTDVLIVEYEHDLYQEKSLINKIKNDENLAGIPIIVISSCHTREIEKEFEHITFGAIIDKSDYNEEKFINIIDEILKKKSL